MSTPFVSLYIKLILLSPDIKKQNLPFTIQHVSHANIHDIYDVHFGLHQLFFANEIKFDDFIYKPPGTKILCNGNIIK